MLGYLESNVKREIISLEFSLLGVGAPSDDDLDLYSLGNVPKPQSLIIRCNSTSVGMTRQRHGDDWRMDRQLTSTTPHMHIAR